MRQRGKTTKTKVLWRSHMEGIAVEACGHNKRIQMELPHQWETPL